MFGRPIRRRPAGRRRLELRRRAEHLRHARGQRQVALDVEAAAEQELLGMHLLSREPHEVGQAQPEQDRRRAIQRKYNEEHGITPVSIVKSMEQVRLSTHVADARSERPEPRSAIPARIDLQDPAKRAAAITALERQMREAAANLEFELAAMLRDQLNDLKAVGAPDVRRTTTKIRRRA